MKEVIIVAGGNGVGKTTWAREFLRENPNYEFLNADEFAREIAPDNPEGSPISAGKMYFARMAKFLDAEKSILIETTLSGRYLIKLIGTLKERDYRIRIVLVFVDSGDILIERIKNRVAKGGHFVPPDDAVRRFHRGKDNFVRIYKDLSDAWTLVYNDERGHQTIAEGDRHRSAIFDQELYDIFLAI